MLTPIGNIHNYDLPALGAIGYIVNGYERWTNNPLYWGEVKRKCIVDSYPLCDNVWPYSHGIHTVNVKFLDNGQVARFSALYFEEV